MTSSQTPDRPFVGVLLMVMFCVMVPVSDGIAKYLGVFLPMALIVLARFLVQAVLFSGISLVARHPLIVPRALFWLIVIRAALHVAGLAMMFISFRYLPLADALAIAYVMPFFILFLGHFFLGEHVGPYRIGASVVGFAGTLMVIQPNFLEVGAPALLPIGVAVVFALFMLITRKLAKEITPISLQGISGTISTVLILPFLAFGSVVPDLRIFLPDAETLALLGLLGLIGAVAHLLLSWSLRFAPSATLAPMQYLEIPFATLVGWLMFRELPNGLAAVGIVVTVGAGLYVIYREHRQGRKTAPAVPD